jgi:hypothetical protein
MPDTDPRIEAFRQWPAQDDLDRVRREGAFDLAAGMDLLQTAAWQAGDSISFYQEEMNHRVANPKSDLLYEEWAEKAIASAEAGIARMKKGLAASKAVRSLLTRERTAA